jgi:hypothetical protein
MGEFNKQQRDMGEAHILSGRLAETERAQQQLDRLDQQLGILSKLKDSAAQTARTNEIIAQRQKEVDEKLKTLPRDIADEIRRVGKDVEDPLDALERAHGFAPVPGESQTVARDADLAKRMAAATVNIPIFGE